VEARESPIAIYAFVGLLCWNFFSNVLRETVDNSLLANKALLAKTQFPRECFPLETMGVQALNTIISWIPLTHVVRHLRTGTETGHPVGARCTCSSRWSLPPAVGLVHLEYVIIQMRDLMQMLPLLTTLGLFATPVIWPFSEIPTAAHVSGGQVHQRSTLSPASRGRTRTGWGDSPSISRWCTGSSIHSDR
jgi:ABC-type polysaccharide/polyol phosphate export permease